MDGLIQIGIDWIVAIQSMGGWLEVPMKFFSFLGTQDFFFLILPLIYWSIDAVLGVQVGLILISSVSVNLFVKLWFAGPRPYWVSERVIPFSSEPWFGIPSGHAQNAATIWGIIAGKNRKTWAWVSAVLLAFLIGFSRLYLGVHFVHDVLAGWLIGFALLWGFLRFWDPIVTWLKKKSFSQQAALSFLVSMVILVIGLASVERLAGYALPEEWVNNALRAGEAPHPVTREDPVTSAGSFFGVGFGLAWIASKGGYQATGPVGKRALRFFIGLIGVLILWRGLALVLPEGADLVPLVFRYIRYALVGFWIIAGAPWLFFRIKLADPPKM